MERSLKSSDGTRKRGDKNIKAYKSLKAGLQSKGWVAKIPTAAVRSSTKSIMQYTGIGKMEVPGSFLVEVSGITNLSAPHLAEVLDMSKTSYYRAQKEAELDMETVDKLASLFKIFQKGIEAFESQEAFEEWLHSKVTNMGDQKPIELIKTESGRSTVLDAIYRVEYGIYG